MGVYADTPASLSTTPPPLVEMRAITRRFPGVLAFSDVEFDLRPGEVRAPAGENGAGKSTLTEKIFFGTEIERVMASDVARQGQIPWLRRWRKAQT